MSTGILVRRFAGLAVLALTVVALGGEPVRATDDPAALHVEDTGIDPWAVWSTHGYDRVPGQPDALDAYGRVLQPLDAAWSTWDAAGLTLPMPGVSSLQRLLLPDRGECIAVVNDRPGDVVRGEHLRALSLAWVELARNSGGAFSAQMASGAAVAYEVTWWPTKATAPNSANVLPRIAALTASGEGADVLLGLVYAYGADGWQARLDELAGQGVPVEAATSAFLGRLASTLGNRTDLVIGGVGLELTGDLAANDDVIVTSDGVHVSGAIHAAGDLIQTGVLAIDGVLDSLSTPLVALPVLDIAEARALARSAGTWFSQDAILRGELPDGALVFAERDIVVEAWGLSRTVTLVSATGSITVRGGALSLTPAREGLLAVAHTGCVEIEVSSSHLVGAVHAPGGEVRLALDATSHVGRLEGRSARIEGRDGRFLTGVPKLPTRPVGPELLRGVLDDSSSLLGGLAPSNDPAGPAAPQATQSSRLLSRFGR